DDGHFATDARRRHVGLLVVPGHRLSDFRGTFLDEPELHGFVAVALRVLRLDDDAWSGFDDGGGMNRAVRIEDLRHADFLADNPCDHLVACGALQMPGYLCSFPNALISTSTPAGRSSF